MASTHAEIDSHVCDGGSHCRMDGDRFVAMYGEDGDKRVAVAVAWYSLAVKTMSLEAYIGSRTGSRLFCQVEVAAKKS